MQPDLNQTYRPARSDAERIKNDLQEELDEATTRADSLQHSYTQIKRASALKNSKYEQSIKSLHSEIEALRRRLEENSNDISSAATLEATIAKLQSDLEFQNSIYADNERLEKEITDLEAQFQTTRNENQTLVSEIQRLKSRGEIRIRSSEKQLKLAVAGLKTFETIDIHGDAADTIIEGFTNPAPLFEILSKLNSGKQVPSKSISTAQGWFEVDKHINTGQSNMGRLYFKKQDTGRLFVVVHHKKNDTEQQRFFGKLSDPNIYRDLSFDQR